MTSDSHNNITSMVYDLDNLPMPPCGIPTFTIIIDGISVTVNGTQVQYFYDANGNRFRKYDGTTNTYYIIGAGGQTQTVKTMQDTTVNTTYNILVPQAGPSTGQDNIGQVRIDTGSYNRYYYLSDHLGSVRVTVDASGNVAGYNDFYPFGETMPGRSMVSSADQRYGYIGVEHDVETGLYATGPRTYDPWKVGFDQPDPVTTDTTLMSWSMYQYGFDNPVRFKDPSGKWPDWFDRLTIAASNWIADEQSQFASWFSNSLGYQNMNSDQMQAQEDYQNSDLGTPTQAQVEQTQFQVGSKFLYANGLADIRATSATLSLASTAGVFEGIGIASTALSLSGASATWEYNNLAGKDQTMTYVSAGLTLATWGIGYSPLSKTVSVGKTVYNYYSLFNK